MRALRKEDKGKEATPAEGDFCLPTLSEISNQERIIRRVADTVHQLNELISRAVKTGVSVELVRASRWHDGAGNWGDQMAPLIRQSKRPGAGAKKQALETATDSKGRAL